MLDGVNKSKFVHRPYTPLESNLWLWFHHTNSVLQGIYRRREDAAQHPTTTQHFVCRASKQNLQSSLIIKIKKNNITERGRHHNQMCWNTHWNTGYYNMSVFYYIQFELFSLIEGGFTFVLIHSFSFIMILVLLIWTKTGHTIVLKNQCQLQPTSRPPKKTVRLQAASAQSNPDSLNCTWQAKDTERKNQP